jgi:hypothetical protein
MTTRNFRVNNGLSVGDIVIDASANTIVGLATAAPSADGDVSNKKYVDDSIAAISTTAINQGDSNVTVTDSGTGAITVSADATEVANFAAAATTITASGAINLTAGSDVVIPANVGVTFGSGEKIEGDNTDLTVTSGGAINLTAATDVVVPANVGVTFGSGEKIEGDNTDLTITSGGTINLTAATDVVIPANVGVTFGSGEKIEGDSTDLTVTSGGKINLTATTDVHIPNAVGLKFGDGGEHIETDNTDFTITSGGKLNLSPDSDVHLPANKGLVFGSGEKIEGDSTDLTVTSGGAINLTATTDVVVPANVGITFGSGEKIEGDNTDLTITSGGAINLSSGNTVAVTGALTVTGDLTINGTTTTVASTVTTHADPLIELNTGATSNANDLGFVFERGSTGNNAAIIWDESADKFSMGTTTATGSSTGDMTLTAGTLVLNTLEGDVTGNLTGNADTATALATARAIGGVNFDGTAAINLPGVNTAGNQDTSGTAAVATAVTASDESTDTTCNVLFVTAATGDLPPKTGTNLTFNSANGTLTTTTFVGDLTGTATAAEYSDVAERFASDTAYEPGTVVALGGAEEITQVNEEGSDEVFGVISSLDQAAFKMNGGAGNDATHPYIAMTGRVNVKVIGSVSKGDRLISASVPGYAKAAIKSECTAFNVIGRALTSKTEAGQGTVLAAVRVSH